MTITETTTVAEAQSAYEKAVAAAEKKGAPFMQLSEFAETIGVSRATLSNWRGRYDDFPAPGLVCGTVELFARKAMAVYARGMNYGDDVINKILTGK